MSEIHLDRHSLESARTSRNMTTFDEKLVLYCGKLPDFIKGLSYTGSQNGAADAILRDNIPCTVYIVAPGGGPDPKPRSGAAGVTPGDGEIRLDLDSLVPVVQELFSAGVAASSMKAYRTGQNRYVHYCERYSILPYQP